MRYAWVGPVVSIGCVLGGAGCGRLGFERATDERGDGGTGNAGKDGSLDTGQGALPCGLPRRLGELRQLPVGMGLATVSGGVVVAWTEPTPAGEDTALLGLRFGVANGDLYSQVPLGVRLPAQLTAFGLVGDGDARLMLSADVPGAAMYVPLGADLAFAGESTRRDDAVISGHGVAAPSAPGGAFAAAWVDDSEIQLARLDARGDAEDKIVDQRVGGAVAIRAAAGRHMVTWTAPAATGCAVWALDGAFDPVIADPRLHAPGGACEKPAVTRHEIGTNLLMWIDGGAAHGQLGTDTDFVGGELSLGAPAEDLEVAPAPSGFFYAVATGDGVEPGHIRVDGTQVTRFPTVQHTTGTPLRLLAYDRDALLVTAAAAVPLPELWLTRLCEPGATAR